MCWKRREVSKYREAREIRESLGRSTVGIESAVGLRSVWMISSSSREGTLRKDSINDSTVMLQNSSVERM